MIWLGARSDNWRARAYELGGQSGGLLCPPLPTGSSTAISIWTCRSTPVSPRPPIRMSVAACPLPPGCEPLPWEILSLLRRGAGGAGFSALSSADRPRSPGKCRLRAPLLPGIPGLRADLLPEAEAALFSPPYPDRQRSAAWLLSGRRIGRSGADGCVDLVRDRDRGRLCLPGRGLAWPFSGPAFRASCRRLARRGQCGRRLGGGLPWPTYVLALPVLAAGAILLRRGAGRDQRFPSPAWPQPPCCPRDSWGSLSSRPITMSGSAIRSNSDFATNWGFPAG